MIGISRLSRLTQAPVKTTHLRLVGDRVGSINNQCGYTKISPRLLINRDYGLESVPERFVDKHVYESAVSCRVALADEISAVYPNREVRCKVYADARSWTLT